MKKLKQNKAVILFAKAPVAGKAKTRLQPHISPKNSARLQEALIKDSITKINEIQNAEKFVYFWPDENRNMFEDLIGDLPVSLVCQYGFDLGEKMSNAFSDLFSRGFCKIVIIGVDSPTLPVEYIDRAFIALGKSELVLGPSTDGGYYLIGLKEKVSPVFSSVKWGSNEVLSQTEDLIKKNNIKTSILPVHYDIDTMENLLFLKTHLKLLKLSGGYIPVSTENIVHDIKRQVAATKRSCRSGEQTK